MGLLESSSFKSRCRGYDYYIENKVLSIKEIDNGIYSAVVKGSGQSLYHVELHLAHPKTSTCSCPHANGKRIICKHIVAAYFKAFPQEAERFYNECAEVQQQTDQNAQAMQERVISFVAKMKKDELQNIVLEMLFQGPDWQFERFIRENGLDT